MEAARSAVGGVLGDDVAGKVLFEAGPLGPIDVTILALVLVAIVGVWLASSLFSPSSKRVIKREKVCLLVGESGGGKTALFWRLQQPKESPPDTISSLETNMCTLNDGGGAGWEVRDIPGHGRVRQVSDMWVGYCGKGNI